MGLFANWKALVSGFPSVLDWNRYTKALALMRGQNGVRVFLQNGGAVIEGDGNITARVPFDVFIDGANTIGVVAGYAQTQTGTLTSVAARSAIAVSADMAVFARYDLGLAGTSTPGWEVVAGSIIQTAATLPTYDARYRVVPIAAVTWGATPATISEIIQHHHGMIPCPDMVHAGTVDFYDGTTVPHGWRHMTEAEARVLVVYKSGDADYGAIGNTGGGNSILDLGHKHSLRLRTIPGVPGFQFTPGGCYLNDTAETPCSDNSAEWCDDAINDETGEVDIRMQYYVLNCKIHL